MESIPAGVDTYTTSVVAGYAVVALVAYFCWRVVRAYERQVTAMSVRAQPSIELDDVRDLVEAFGQRLAEIEEADRITTLLLSARAGRGEPAALPGPLTHLRSGSRIQI